VESRPTPHRRLRSLLFGLALVSGAAQAFGAPPSTANVDAGGIVDASGDSSFDQELVDAVSSKRTELDSLLAFREGRLGARRSSELFRIDLHDDAPVRRRLAELRRELDAARNAGDAGLTFDGGQHLDASKEDSDSSDLLAAEPSRDALRLLTLRALEVRIEILSRPKAERDALLANEQEASRAEIVRQERERAEHEVSLAEQARLDALQTAQEARTNAERRLAEIRAGASAVRAEQVRARADLAETVRDAAVDEQSRAEAVETVRGAVDTVAAASPEADSLYDRLVGRLVELRANADGLLRELERGAHVPRFEKPVTLPQVTDSALVEERARLEELIASLDTEANALATENRAVSWSSLSSVMTTERQLNGLRIALLARVSPRKHDSVLGFGPEGRAQGLREVERVSLEIRWLRARGWETLRDAQRDLQQPATVAKLSLQFTALGGLLWVTLFVRRRRSVWLRSARNTAARAIRTPAVLRLLQRTTAALDAVSGEVVVLGAVLLIPLLPGVEVTTSVWLVPYTLLLWYWIYRFALVVTHRTLAFAASKNGMLAGEVGARILRSVRLVGRSCFFFAVLLASATAVVGRGYLHGLVVRAAWVLAAPIATVLVRWWRDDIANAYLHVRPDGALSHLVARTRKRWLGFFVAIVAFGALVVGGLVRALRRFVLGFEQSRKALAFLFRRRLERRIAGTSPEERPLLDDELLTYFSEQPVEEPTLIVDRYPGLRDLSRRLDRFQKGERIGPTLLVGRTGFGKTSWLLAVERHCTDVPVTQIRLRDRAVRPDRVLAVIAAAVGMPMDAPVDVDTVVRHINANGKRLITVDDAQLWFLRGIETLEAWRSFSLVVERTNGSAVWVVTFAHYAWEFVSWITKGDHVFRSIVHLNPWSESEIGRLLERRNKASGLEIVYDDLLVDDVHDGNDDARILTTARDYNRLIWDYAEGSPRVAIHVWARSLLPDGPGKARVRLFMNPSTTALESLSETCRFVLAAIVWHERMSVDDVAIALRLSRAECEAAFHRLVDDDIAERVGDNVRVAPRWWPVVVRYLRRKHLIET
jgi:hypothetical protein